MKKSSKWTAITIILAIAFAIACDIWLDAKPDAYTWSQYIQQKALSDPIYPAVFCLVFGLIIGILIGHWFFPKRIRA